VAELSGMVWALRPGCRSAFAHILYSETEKEKAVLASFLCRCKAAASGFFHVLFRNIFVVSYRKNHTFATRYNNTLFLFVFTTTLYVPHLYHTNYKYLINNDVYFLHREVR